MERVPVGQIIVRIVADGEEWVAPAGAAFVPEVPATVATSCRV